MDTIIFDIYDIIKDYRANENDSTVLITPERINQWVFQFEEKHRLTILYELKNIFSKHYCSEMDAFSFLYKFIVEASKQNNHKNEIDFLLNCNFISLQKKGKSQSELLLFLDELLQVKFNISLNKCGTKSKRYSVYIDDVLNTGLTLINNIKEWCKMSFDFNKTNLQAVEDGSTTLILFYFFVHGDNYIKKRYEIEYKISKTLSHKHQFVCMHLIDNRHQINSSLEIFFPTKKDNQIIERFKDIIKQDVRNYTINFSKSPKEKFYRNSDFPEKEIFFTTKSNRDLIEHIFLLKGIEILNSINSKISNIRPLGYSLPSSNDFGFGATTFTWRNIANNTPLVFWYETDKFMPLFKVKRGNNYKISNMKSKGHLPAVDIIYFADSQKYNLTIQNMFSFEQADLQYEYWLRGFIHPDVQPEKRENIVEQINSGVLESQDLSNLKGIDDDYTTLLVLQKLIKERSEGKIIGKQNVITKFSETMFGFSYQGKPYPFIKENDEYYYMYEDCKIYKNKVVCNGQEYFKPKKNNFIELMGLDLLWNVNMPIINE